MSVADLGRRVNRELERLILVDPDQVFWLHDRYGIRRGAPRPRRRATGPDAPSEESSR
jgi:lauroyl/myristoyl acyltransferase